MATRPARIEWHQPHADSIRRMMASRSGIAPAAMDVTASHQQLDPVIQTMLRVGVPLAEGVASGKELAIHLLKFAAEVEHALMAQYLYTYVSIVNVGTPAVDHEREVLNVAIQEMGHLATVQNILMLLGGPSELHLERDLYRKN